LSSDITAILILAGLFTTCHRVNESPADENRIIFFGDSITEQGDQPGGYVSLLRDTLKSTAQTTHFEIIGAGIGGDRVPDLLDRVDRDVLDRLPTVVVVYIGINDVWHHALFLRKGTPKDEFESGLRYLVGKMLKNGVRVMLCTPSVIGERHDGSNTLDIMLEEYSAISRSVAVELHVPLCDLRKSFVEFLKRNNQQNKESGILTTDSVHLNDAGNRFVATEILRVLKESNLIEFRQ